MAASFKVEQPSTIYLSFTTPPDVVKVFHSGQVYFFRYLKKDMYKIKFNVIHTGRYFCDNGNIEKIVAIEIQPLKVNLPTPDRNRIKPYKFVYSEELKNGTPARNFTAKGLIEYGDKFRALPFPCRLFILLHEIGHFYYEKETDCDLFAAYHFIKMGYNNSTAFYSISEVLKNSPENTKRVMELFNNLNVEKW